MPDQTEPTALALLLVTLAVVTFLLFAARSLTLPKQCPPNRSGEEFAGTFREHVVDSINGNTSSPST